MIPCSIYVALVVASVRPRLGVGVGVGRDTQGAATATTTTSFPCSSESGQCTMQLDAWCNNGIRVRIAPGTHVLDALPGAIGVDPTCGSAMPTASHATGTARRPRTALPHS